mmetsp:Transcript_49973/g.85560  ORF Transcript_49973/g.85560 Transcript_49973/m.85560 type:complete len:217 (-) Transcript_49973:45-695(-)
MANAVAERETLAPKVVTVTVTAASAAAVLVSSRAEGATVGPLGTARWRRQRRRKSRMKRPCRLHCKGLATARTTTILVRPVCRRLLRVSTPPRALLLLGTAPPPPPPQLNQVAGSACVMAGCKVGCRQPLFRRHQRLTTSRLNSCTTPSSTATTTPAVENSISSRATTHLLLWQRRRVASKMNFSAYISSPTPSSAGIILTTYYGHCFSLLTIDWS